VIEQGFLANHCHRNQSSVDDDLTATKENLTQEVEEAFPYRLLWWERV
jgi:hypothetical protein